MSDHDRRLYRIAAAIIAALWVAGGVAFDCGANNTGAVLLILGMVLAYGLIAETKEKLK